MYAGIRDAYRDRQGISLKNIHSLDVIGIQRGSPWVWVIIKTFNIRLNPLRAVIALVSLLTQP
jgi:hypothetical protein